MNDKVFARLEKKIGYKFRSRLVLENALTHTSYANENAQKKLESNERMEFFGDAVLGVIITEHIYNAFPKFSEGRLTIIKSKLVSGAYLAMLSRQIELGDFLLLGKGEERLGGREKDSILSCAFEALVAALYIDGGLDPARKFIVKVYKKEFGKLAGQKDHLDYKSRLQKLTQGCFGAMPVYRVVAETGPDHKKKFKIGVKAGGGFEASAVGRSKKEAEQKAAMRLLKRIEKK